MTRSTKLTSLLLVLVFIAPLLVSACGKSVGETIDDATITTRVKTALLNDPAPLAKALSAFARCSSVSRYWATNRLK